MITRPTTRIRFLTTTTTLLLLLLLTVTLLPLLTSAAGGEATIQRDKDSKAIDPWWQWPWGPKSSTGKSSSSSTGRSSSSSSSSTGKSSSSSSSSSSTGGISSSSISSSTGPAPPASSSTSTTVLSSSSSSSSTASSVDPSSPIPMNNSALFVVDVSPAALECRAPLSDPNHTCFIGQEVNFQQTCDPACYWGGLCNANRCTKQMKDCIVFCPDSYTCSYGYCVSTPLVPRFLQLLTPYLYTTNARIQPTDPTKQPLYQGGNGSTEVPTDSQYQNGGVGGSVTGPNNADAASGAHTERSSNVLLLFLGIISVLSLLQI